MAVVTSAGVTVRSYLDWAQKAQVKAPGALRALWAGDDRLVVAGSSLIETVAIAPGVEGPAPDTPMKFRNIWMRRLDR